MDGKFLTQQVEIIFATDLSCAKLLKPVRYVAKSGVVYELPYAQPTDFASTPKETWGFPLYLIPTGWWSIPVFFHDSAFQAMLLLVQPDGTKIKAFQNSTDEQAANNMLLEMMQAIKPEPTVFETAQMQAIYAGVTIGGWHAWRADRS